MLHQSIRARERITVVLKIQANLRETINGNYSVVHYSAFSAFGNLSPWAEYTQTHSYAQMDRHAHARTVIKREKEQGISSSEKITFDNWYRTNYHADIPSLPSSSVSVSVNQQEKVHTAAEGIYVGECLVLVFRSGIL